MTDGAILWRSDTAIAVDKPAGMLVHNSAFAGSREPSLRQAVGAALGRRVYPIHRVDRGTSGVVLLAHERELVEPWQRALGEPSAVKIYLSICRGRLAATHDVQRPVAGSDGVRREARSIVVPLENASEVRCSLVAVRILTGRHHQARRHLAGLSHPVVNDATHGNSRFNREFRAVVALERLALHAWHLAVTDPFTGARVTVTCAPTGALGEAIGRLFPGVTPERLAAVVASLSATD